LMSGQPGFFDVEERYPALSKAGDPLERLQQVVDFEVFREPLEAALGRSDWRRGGRPPYDAVVMFKALVLQTLYGLSDEQLEFQIRDRLSFMRFFGLGLADRIPDATTIWLFSRAAQPSRGGRRAVRPVRPSSQAARLSGDVGPDRGRLHRRRAAPAHGRGREGRIARRAHAGVVGSQPRAQGAERPGWAVDA
jgi:hypothetical protein